LLPVGLCYALVTAIEIVYFATSMTALRVVGLGLQAGFAAALVYAGSIRRPAVRPGMSTGPLRARRS
jgi:hypothetical protein